MIDNTILDDLRLQISALRWFITPARVRVRSMVRSLARNRTMTQKTHGHMRESKSPYASSLLHRAHLAANPSTPRLRERRDSARLDGPRRLVLQCPRGVTEGPATKRQLSMSQIELRTQTRDSGLRERGESHLSFVTPRARGEPLEFRYSESEGRATRVSSLRERARGEPLEFRYSESERAGRATRDSSRCSPHCHTLRSSGRA